MSMRLKLMGQKNYRNGFELTLHPHALELPLKWKKPQRIFVNSMSDLYHKDVPDEFIHQVFATMRAASWHRFQILTKRSERLAAMSASIDWPENVWQGVSVESAEYAHRIEHLRSIGAGVRFLSIEPLLGPLSRLDLRNIQWVIVGGESGPGARPMREEWVIEIRDQCVTACVPFFFKQWGGTNKKKTGRELEGRTWDEMPPLPPLVA
jgi:protein gp37